MAIQIIKAGVKPFVKTCGACGCIFSFQKEDLKVDGPSYEQTYSIRCPFCGKSYSNWSPELLVKDALLREVHGE